MGRRTDVIDISYIIGKTGEGQRQLTQLEIDVRNAMNDILWIHNNLLCQGIIVFQISVNIPGVANGFQARCLLTNEK